MALQNLHRNNLMTISIDQGFSCRLISVLLEITSKLAVSRNKKSARHSYN